MGSHLINRTLASFANPPVVPAAPQFTAAQVRFLMLLAAEDQATVAPSVRADWKSSGARIGVDPAHSLMTQLPS